MAFRSVRKPQRGMNNTAVYGAAYQSGMTQWAYPALTAPGRRSARSVIVLLSLFLLPVSLIPSTKGTFFHFPLLPHIWWTENLLLIFALLVLLYKFFTGSRIATSTFWFLLAPMLLLGLWQIASLTWNDRDANMRIYSLSQSLLMCAAVLSGTILASGMGTNERIRLARWLVLIVGGIVSVYAGLSVLFPGWRPSYDWVRSSTKGLGFIRMYGPLGTSTTLNFVLLPMLGICVGMLFLPRTWKPVWIAASLFFTGCIVLTGSRGGLISFAAFCVLLLPAVRIRSMMFLAPLSIILLFVVLLVGVPERFRSLEDRSRFETYATAVRAWSVDPQTVLFGTGHGGLYSKLHDDSLRYIHGETRWYLIEDKTQYGYTLRNSHSTFVRSLAETGVIGFCLQAIPLFWVTGRLLLPRPGRRDRTLLFGRAVLAGCVAMVVYMAAEEFFITAFWVTVLWTMFTVIAAETVKDETMAVA